jgi:hypothetical protein
MRKELLEYYGTIVSQELIKDFTWNKVDFHQYIVQFDNCDALFLLNRDCSLEQDLINAKLIYNLTDDETKIKKYRVVGKVESKTDRIKELLVKIKERNNGTT